jgi:TrpR-related protein YerC/YecD
MAKFYLNSLPEKARINLIGDFYDMMSCVKNREECRIFLRDLLTPDEMAMLIRRMNVAIFLLKGFTFEEIKDHLKVSADKISSVHRSLERHGEGYALVMKRLEKIKSKRAKRSEMPINEIQMIRKKYPGYFLFNNLFEKISELLAERKNELRINNKKPYLKR